MRRQIMPDAAQAAAACAHQIEAHIEDTLLGQERATLAISGGSSPKAIFSVLASASIDWRRVHVYWVDERCVPPVHEQSNFRMAKMSLIEPAHIPPANVHRVPTELIPDEAAEVYSAHVRDAFGLEDGDIPQFDVMHLGIGADGHTASLFPGEPLIEDRSGIAGAVYVEKLTQWRVTLLPATLLNARHTVVYATGSEKAEILRSILESDYDPARLPAQLTRLSRAVTWFLDEPAASRLS